MLKLLLLLLSHFSRVRLCVTPEMAAHQAPPSLGFSRQEYWSGLPFPSPMHESEKLLSHVRLLAIPWTAAHRAPPSMGFSRQEYWSGVPLPSPLPLLTKTLIPSNQGPPLQPPACVLGCFSHVPLFVTPRTVAHQAPLSMGFSRQEYLSGLPCPCPADLPNPEIKHTSHVSFIGRQVLYYYCQLGGSEGTF